LPQEEARRLSDRRVYTSLVNNIMVDMLTHRAIERFRDISSGKAIEQPAEAEVTAEEMSEPIQEAASENSSDQSGELPVPEASTPEDVAPVTEAMAKEPTQESETSSPEQA
jgi:hypothetical protein